VLRVHSSQRLRTDCDPSHHNLEVLSSSAHLDEAASVPQLVPHLAAAALRQHQALVPCQRIDLARRAGA
jgi:hypothetical protein